MLHSDPTTVRMIHQQMIEDEMARHRMPDPDDVRSERSPVRLGPVLRRATARTLHAFAGWLEPSVPGTGLPSPRQAA